MEYKIKQKQNKTKQNILSTSANLAKGKLAIDNLVSFKGKNIIKFT
jgi:hypothetical protein